MFRTHPLSLHRTLQKMVDLSFLGLNNQVPPIVLITKQLLVPKVTTIRVYHNGRK